MEVLNDLSDATLFDEENIIDKLDFIIITIEIIENDAAVVLNKWNKIYNSFESGDEKKLIANMGLKNAENNCASIKNAKKNITDMGNIKDEQLIHYNIFKYREELNDINNTNNILRTLELMLHIDSNTIPYNNDVVMYSDDE